MVATRHSPPRGARGLAPGANGALRDNPRAPWRQVDMVLVGCVLAVAALGCLMVLSSTRGRDPAAFDTTLAARQALFVGLGVVALVLTTLVDYRRLRDIAPLAYLAMLATLGAVLTGLGSERRGTQAWFDLGAFQLQPSEPAKVVLIVALASLLAAVERELDLASLALVLAVAGAPVALIALQPDVGTALVFVAIVMGVLFVGGARLRHMAALGLAGLIGIGAVFSSGALEEYQRCRLTSFLDYHDEACAQRDASWNQDQSMVAIGAGGLLGRGLFEGTQTRLDLVPEQHTDFIFTVVGEELGLVGSATVLALLSIIAWRILRAAQLARDRLGTLICVGVLSMFVFQVFENVGMAVGIMPVAGIPLPFMSYGGSSTIAAFIAIGLVLNVHMRRFS